MLWAVCRQSCNPFHVDGLSIEKALKRCLRGELARGQDASSHLHIQFESLLGLSFDLLRQTPALHRDSRQSPHPFYELTENVALAIYVYGGQQEFCYWGEKFFREGQRLNVRYCWYGVYEGAQKQKANC